MRLSQSQSFPSLSAPSALIQASHHPGRRHRQAPAPRPVCNAGCAPAAGRRHGGLTARRQCRRCCHCWCSTGCRAVGVAGQWQRRCHGQWQRCRHGYCGGGGRGRARPASHRRCTEERSDVCDPPERGRLVIVTPVVPGMSDSSIVPSPNHRPTSPHPLVPPHPPPRSQAAQPRGAAAAMMHLHSLSSRSAPTIARPSSHICPSPLSALIQPVL